MARVYYGSIIRRISGALRNDVYAHCGRVEYIRKKPIDPNNPNTDRQKVIRDSWKLLCERWAVLDESLRVMWTQYATFIPEYSSGLNAYLHLNARLLSADNINLVVNDVPPLVVTPITRTELWNVNIENGVNTIEWTFDPVPPNIYIQVYWKIHKPNPYNFRSYWHQLETVSIPEGPLNHTHGLDEPTKIHYKIRTIDTIGQQSPWTSEKIVTTIPL